MQPGSLIRFSKEHINSPGHDYVRDWVGIILEYKTGTLNPDPEMTSAEQHFHRNKDEICVAWTIHGETHIMDYDELWWNKLDYDPFEVVYENR